MSERKRSILNKLREIVGKEYVSAEVEDCIAYSRDIARPLDEPRMPDYVVLPGTSEEVQAVVRLANKHKIPITVAGQGTTMAGLTVPLKGGIVISTLRLDKLEINEDTMTAIVGAGVCMGKLKSEAEKKGLRAPIMGGPYAGTIAGNYVGGGVSNYNARFGFADRVITLEAILPNGELIRTGSAAYMGQERSNPYFRQAYGPDLTGLFRQSFSVFGIITGLVFRLFPIGEREEYVDAGFNDMSSFLRAMKRIERHDISSSTHGCDKRNLALITIPDIELLKDPAEFQIYRSSLPEFCLCVELSGTSEQVDVYRKIVEKIVSEEGGSFLKFTKAMEENYRDLVGGAGIRVNRMFYYAGRAVINVLPMSRVVAARERIIKICEKYNMKDPCTGEAFIPPMFIVPNDRGTIIYLEMDIHFAAAENFNKLREFYKESATVMSQEFDGSSMSLGPWFQSQLVPAYLQLVRSIKEAVDPNEIFTPDKMLKRKKE